MQPSLSTHQLLKFWYLAPLLSWLHIRDKLFLDQYRSYDPAEAGCEDCRQEPRAHGSNPSAIRHWLYTSFQNGVPEGRLNRAW